MVEVRNGLGEKKKQIDFYAAYRAKPGVTEAQRTKGLMIALPILLLAAFFAAGGWFLWGNLQLKEQLGVLDHYLNNEDNRAKAKLADEALAREQESTRKRDAYKAPLDAMETYPMVNGPLLQKIDQEATKAVSTKGLVYDHDTATLRWSGTARSVTEAADYIARLRATELFQSITYEGYTSDDTLLYYFEVAAVIRGADHE